MSVYSSYLLFLHYYFYFSSFFSFPFLFHFLPFSSLTFVLSYFFFPFLPNLVILSLTLFLIYFSSSFCYLISLLSLSSFLLIFCVYFPLFIFNVIRLTFSPHLYHRFSILISTFVPTHLSVAFSSNPSLLPSPPFPFPHYSPNFPSFQPAVKISSLSLSVVTSTCPYL